MALKHKGEIWVKFRRHEPEYRRKKSRDAKFADLLSVFVPE
jgi:hypothetical protein